MADEPVTIAIESKRLERLGNELAEANKASDAAIKAAIANNKSQPDNMVALIEHAGAVKLADQVCAKLASSIATAKGNVVRLQWEEKAKPLMDARETLKADVIDCYGGNAGVFDKFGVESITIKIDCTGEQPIASLNVTGEAIPKPPSTVKRSGGGGGGGGKVPLTVDGTEYASASAALMTVFPDFEGKMGRKAIIGKLAAAGHTVS